MGETVNDLEIVRRRLRTQRLLGEPFATPAEAVAGLLAVQSQEYAMAKWALGMRSVRCTDASVEGAFAAGEILRTHILRPTWHFVSPADIRWLLQLTAPRIRRLIAGHARELELDEPTLDSSLETIAKALRGRVALTRRELGEQLSEAGVADASGRRLGHIAMHAELAGLICSGPRAGKQHTYMLLDERAPDRGRRLTDQEALAEGTRRFFTGHGPATAHDFAKWSSLRVSDARAGLELVAGELESFEHDGKTWWHRGLGAGGGAGGALLLAEYDESGAGYRDLKMRMGAPVPGDAGFRKPILVDGECVGIWNRSLAEDAVDLELRIYKRLDRGQVAAVEIEAERYASFLQLAIGSLQWVAS